MEYYLLFLILWSLHWINDYYVLPPQRLLMMSPFQSQIAPYLMLIFLTLIVTTFLHMIRTLRTCPKTPSSTKTTVTQRPWGLTQGLKLGTITAFGSGLAFYLLGLFPFLLTPFMSLSILPYATQIGEGFYWALGGFYGYWLGRLFVTIC